MSQNSPKCHVNGSPFDDTTFNSSFGGDLDDDFFSAVDQIEKNYIKDYGNHDNGNKYKYSNEQNSRHREAAFMSPISRSDANSNKQVPVKRILPCRKSSCSVQSNMTPLKPLETSDKDSAGLDSKRLTSNLEHRKQVISTKYSNRRKIDLGNSQYTNIKQKNVHAAVQESTITKSNSSCQDTSIQLTNTGTVMAGFTAGPSGNDMFMEMSSLSCVNSPNMASTPCVPRSKRVTRQSQITLSDKKIETTAASERKHESSKENIRGIDFCQILTGNDDSLELSLPVVDVERELEAEKIQRKPSSDVEVKGQMRAVTCLRNSADCKDNAQHETDPSQLNKVIPDTNNKVLRNKSLDKLPCLPSKAAVKDVPVSVKPNERNINLDSVGKHSHSTYESTTSTSTNLNLQQSEKQGDLSSKVVESKNQMTFNGRQTRSGSVVATTLNRETAEPQMQKATVSAQHLNSDSNFFLKFFK